jgi:PmbA protein
MDMKVFKEKLFTLAKAAGFEEYEMYCQEGASTSISIFNKEVSEFKNTSLTGVSFRGKYNNKMGYASSERIDESVIDFLVNSAKANAGIIETVEHEELYEGDEKYPELETYNKALDDVANEDKIQKGLLIESSCKEKDARVQSVPYLSVVNGDSGVFIANSKGLNVSGRSNYFYTFAMCQVADGSDVKTGGEMYFGDFAKLDPKKLGETVAGNAVSKFGAAPVPSGKYGVIIDEDVASDMLGVYFGCFSADMAQKGFSLLNGKLNEKIASDCVTIVDDPLIVGAMGSRSFDAEGVAAFTKTVIDEGVFKTFLHNNKTALKDGVKSTGNASKGDFKASVAIGATNFFIKPSETSQAALMEQLGDGLLITSFAGLHAGANPISGEFSLQAEGFVIKDGKKAQPVEQITVSGNFFNLLKNVKAVANDIVYRASNYASPSILIDNLDVAGS